MLSLFGVTVVVYFMKILSGYRNCCVDTESVLLAKEVRLTFENLTCGQLGHINLKPSLTKLLSFQAYICERGCLRP